MIETDEDWIDRDLMRIGMMRLMRIRMNGLMRIGNRDWWELGWSRLVRIGMIETDEDWDDRDWWGLGWSRLNETVRLSRIGMIETAIEVEPCCRSFLQPPPSAALQNDTVLVWCWASYHQKQGCYGPISSLLWGGIHIIKTQQLWNKIHRSSISWWLRRWW